MTTPDLTIAGLAAGYPKRRVIDGLTLAPLPAGSVTSVVGPNAAGKSTLLRALAGLLPATGSIRLGDAELNGMERRRRAGQVGFMPQSLPDGADLFALETVIAALAVNPIDAAVVSQKELRRRAMTIFEQLEIAELALEPIHALSGGQRQLISLAQAIVREPMLLLLDEPTSALDMRHQVQVMSVIRAFAATGRVVVMVLHDLSLAARWSDRIIVLRDGAFAGEGLSDEVISPALLASVYGVAARVERCSAGRLQILVDGLEDVAPPTVDRR